MIADEEVRKNAEEALGFLHFELLLGGIGRVRKNLELHECGSDAEGDGWEIEGLAGKKVAGGGGVKKTLEADGEGEGAGGNAVEGEAAVGGGEGLAGGGSVGGGEPDGGAGNEGILGVDERAGECGGGGVGRGGLGGERGCERGEKETEGREAARECDAATDGLTKNGQRARHYKRLTSSCRFEVRYGWAG